jgi:peptide-methionine (S)-S-oxide reductase
VVSLWLLVTPDDSLTTVFLLFKPTAHQMRGVKRVVVGYTGGLEPDPTSRNIQDHTLALFIEFNTQKISLKAILDMWHDNDDPWRERYEETYTPTVGSVIVVDEEEESTAIEKEDRSAIFTTTAEQHFACLEFIRALSATRPYDELQVQVDRATTFYQAEEYHQDYLTKQVRAAQEQVEMYCNGVIKSGLFTIQE